MISSVLWWRRSLHDRGAEKVLQRNEKAGFQEACQTYTSPCGMWKSTLTSRTLHILLFAY